MTDGDALYEAILAAPADDAPRLVFADWLTERGSKADVARASFIRAQVALSRNDAPIVCDGLTCLRTGKLNGPVNGHFGTYTKHCRCPYCKLKRQEWVAWRQHGCEWQAEFYSLLAEQEVAHALRTGEPVRRLPLNYDGPRCEFSRGMISTVRLPLATLMAEGEKCNRCEGSGEEQTQVGAPVQVNCSSCHGTGRLPGVAELLGRLPLQRIEVTDREPVLSAEDTAIGWIRGDHHVADILHPRCDLLPVELFDHLIGGTDQYDSVTWRRFPTADAALAALSDAALAWCRSRANQTPAGASVVEVV